MRSDGIFYKVKLQIPWSDLGLGLDTVAVPKDLRGRPERRAGAEPTCGTWINWPNIPLVDCHRRMLMSVQPTPSSRVKGLMSYVSDPPSIQTLCTHLKADS